MGSLPNRSSFPQPCFRCDLDRMVREVYGDVNSKNGDDSDGFLTHFDSGMFGESGDVVTLLHQVLKIHLKLMNPQVPPSPILTLTSHLYIPSVHNLNFLLQTRLR